jgi:acetolactate synthase-1/2/3 large subunit
MNTVIGMGTAYVDSTAVALATGSPHTYMRGHGLFQELGAPPPRRQPAGVRAARSRSGGSRRASTTCRSLLHRAWNAMHERAPGPVLLDLPMDVQAEAADVTIARPGDPPRARAGSAGRRRRSSAPRPGLATRAPL